MSGRRDDERPSRRREQTTDIEEYYQSEVRTGQTRQANRPYRLPPPYRGPRAAPSGGQSSRPPPSTRGRPPRPKPSTSYHENDRSESRQGRHRGESHSGHQRSESRESRHRGESTRRSRRPPHSEHVREEVRESSRHRHPPTVESTSSDEDSSNEYSYAAETLPSRALVIPTGRPRPRPRSPSPEVTSCEESMRKETAEHKKLKEASDQQRRLREEQRRAESRKESRKSGGLLGSFFGSSKSRKDKSKKKKTSSKEESTTGIELVKAGDISPLTASDASFKDEEKYYNPRKPGDPVYDLYVDSREASPEPPIIRDAIRSGKSRPRTRSRSGSISNETVHPNDSISAVGRRPPGESRARYGRDMSRETSPESREEASKPRRERRKSRDVPEFRPKKTDYAALRHRLRSLSPEKKHHRRGYAPLPPMQQYHPMGPAAFSSPAPYGEYVSSHLDYTIPAGAGQSINSVPMVPYPSEFSPPEEITEHHRRQSYDPPPPGTRLSNIRDEFPKGAE